MEVDTFQSVRNAKRCDLVSIVERGKAPIAIDLETVTEARLVAQALAGSQAAVEQIVRRYQRPIIRLIARITADPALAEDLAQDTFVKAFRNLAAFDTTRRLSSWLFRIAHNTALDAMRRARPSMSRSTRRQKAGTSLRCIPSPTRSNSRRWPPRWTRRMAHVRPEQRAVLTLRYEEGLSFEEIGHGARDAGGDRALARPPCAQRALPTTDRGRLGPFPSPATRRRGCT